MVEDLQSVNDIINGAVKDSSYITVLISSCVYILYTLIIKLIELFKAKDRNKPIVQMANAIHEISENVVKLNQVLDKTIQNAEIKESTRIDSIITTGFNSFKAKIFSHCVNIIVHNNIEDRHDAIKVNLFKIVNTEYYKLFSILSAYEIGSVNVATKIKEEWIDDITNECLQIIYNSSDSVERIRQLDNKLDLIIEGYIIYLKNKMFNH